MIRFRDAAIVLTLLVSTSLVALDSQAQPAPPAAQKKEPSSSFTTSGVPDIVSTGNTLVGASADVRAGFETMNRVGLQNQELMFNIGHGAAQAQDYESLLRASERTSSVLNGVSTASTVVGVGITGANAIQAGRACAQQGVGECWGQAADAGVDVAVTGVGFAGPAGAMFEKSYTATRLFDDNVVKPVLGTTARDWVLDNVTFPLAQKAGIVPSDQDIFLSAEQSQNQRNAGRIWDRFERNAAQAEAAANQRYQSTSSDLVQQQEQENARQALAAQQLQQQQQASSGGGGSGMGIVNSILAIGGAAGAAYLQQQQQALSTPVPQPSSGDAGGGARCTPKTFNTPDGCHPGHNENSHRGGCHCG